jgi:NhaA family Na+:H+ antiporter
MPDRLERVSSILITLAAILIAASVAARTVRSESHRHERVKRDPIFIAEWRDALPSGILVGPQGASVTLIEFADLECPVCRTFHGTVTELLREFDGRIAYVYVAYPLDSHRFAYAAARGAECAAERGKFTEWIDVVYRKQDSLGLKTWESFASEAGIADSTELATCAKDPRPVSRIDSGLALGDKFGIPGTPAVLVNGWLMPGAPTKRELKSTVGALLRGEVPFD